VKRAFCLIGDLVASRRIADRRRVQDVLRTGLDRLNLHRRDIVSPYTITLGDEFQAVYADPRRVFRDMLAIQCLLHPHRVRFAVGAGSITTAINRRTAIGMDGPAFIAARESLTALKGDPGSYRVAGLRPRTNEWANLSLDLVSHLVRSWRRNRFEIAVARLDGRPPLEIASSMHLTAAAVYKNIAAGALPAVTAMLELLGAVLASPESDES
jgi:hypothetical protein